KREVAVRRVKAKDVQLATLMLAGGLDLSDGDNRYALAEAAERGHGEMVKLLLQHGANPNVALIPEAMSMTPLERMRHGMSAEEAARFSIKNARSEMEMNKSTLTPAEAKQVAVSGIMNWMRAGQTALLLAAAGGHLDIVEQLLNKGADAKVRDRLGRTALWKLVAAGRTASILELERISGSMDRSSGPNSFWPLEGDVVAPLPTKQMSSLLQWASKGDNATATTLLAHGCPVNTPDNKGMTPLQVAAIYSSPAVVETLLKGGAQIAVKGQSESILHQVISSGRRETRSAPVLTVLHLVFTRLEGVEAESVNPTQYRRPPVAQATSKAEVPRIRADLFRQRRQLLATWGGQDASVVKSLIQHGALVNARDNSGLTPLMRSARSGQIEVARVLIEAGADVNAVNKNGETALMQVIAHGLRRSPIKAPLNTDGTPAVGEAAKVPVKRTALLRQTFGGEDANIISLLLQNGANKQLKNRQGQTGSVLARQIRHIEAQAALK
ncbi:MAG TPA: ankyrin repeat domain-containing protein, partial [Abditibacteriaceae bacterium]